MRRLPLLLLVAACSSTEAREPVSAGLIEGQVFTAQGQPVTGATVTATARRALFAPVVAQDSATSGPDGRYQLVLRSAEFLDADAVAEVRAQPPANTPLIGRDSSAVTVWITPADPPPDTARVDFHLSYKPD
jgi:hypothetical protein